MEVHDWRMKSQDSLSKYEYVPLLNQVINTRLIKETVKNGFQTTWLFPWDSSVIGYSKCVSKKVENEIELELEPVTTKKTHVQAIINKSAIKKNCN